MTNPANCDNGISFALFYYPDYDEQDEEDFFNPTKTFEKEYILSTGGEDGTPGIAIYRQGPDLGAVVSTGNLTWHLEVKGAVPAKRRWTNLAVRWEPPLVSNQEEYNERLLQGFNDTQMGGLQFFINLETYGIVIFPDIYGCEHRDNHYECQTEMPAVKEEFDPPQAMLGCHRTKADPEARMFTTGGGYDELAMWDRRLNDSDLPLFLGGYSKKT